MVVSAPSLLLALLMLLTAEEPPRGGFEEALRETYAEGYAYTETITWSGLKVLLKVPSNWLSILQVRGGREEGGARGRGGGASGGGGGKGSGAQYMWGSRRLRGIREGSGGWIWEAEVGD